ncbi:MAG: TVP38/TMEM64 family protein [Candidatus Tyrphobacter sp.]
MNPLLRRLAAVALLAASFLLAVVVIRYQPLVEHVIRTVYPWAYPFAIAIFALVASAPFSVTDALAIMNGAVFGPVVGSIVSAIGIVCGALLGYWINRRASQLLDLDAYVARLPKWAKHFKVGSPAFLLAVRVIPGFGGTVATATAASMRVPIWVHVWTMSLIAIPICTILAVGGNQITMVIHRYEVRVHAYFMHHHPRFHFRLHRSAAPTP